MKGNDFGEAVSRILSSPLRAERIICLSSRYPRPTRFRAIAASRCMGLLFGLAPDGVFRAASLTLRAVRSYRTFSPLPDSNLRPNRRFILCGTVRRATSRWHRPRVSPAEPELRGIALCGVRTFLRATHAAQRSSAPPKSRAKVRGLSGWCKLAYGNSAAR
jgi:hypothetical protein